MQFKEEIVLSQIFKPNLRQLRGAELHKAVESKGYSHIHIDDDDTFYAVDRNGMVVSHMYGFIKQVADMKKF